MRTLSDARIHWLNEYDDIQKKATNLVTSFLTGIHNKQADYELH